MKFFAVVAFAAFFAVASSAGIGNKNLITDIIEGIINKNKDKLANLNVALIDLGEFGTISNLNLVGLELFNVDKLEAAGPLSVDIKNATVTLATVTGGADLDAKNIQVPEIGLNVNGLGNAVGDAQDLFATVALNLELVDLKPVLKDFTDLYISIGNLNLVLAGVDDVDNTNAVIAGGLKQYLNDNIVTIANENKDTIITKVNEILGGLA